MEIEGVKARRMRSDESLNERAQGIREAEDARESSDVKRTREILITDHGRKEKEEPKRPALDKKEEWKKTEITGDWKSTAQSTGAAGWAEAKALSFGKWDIALSDSRVRGMMYDAGCMSIRVASVARRPRHDDGRIEGLIWSANGIAGSGLCLWRCFYVRFGRMIGGEDKET
jgi:hypothetical protein